MAFVLEAFLPARRGDLHCELLFRPMGLDPFATSRPRACALDCILVPPRGLGSLPAKSLHMEISETASPVAPGPGPATVPAATRLPCLASSLRYPRHNSPGGLRLRHRMPR